MECKESDIAKRYAEALTTQMRKGLLSYLMLVVAERPIYAPDIIRRLSAANLTVVEGTIYPLLSRLQRDELLRHEWRESEQGPPRKYYSLTKLGQIVAIELKKQVRNLNQATKMLEKSENNSKRKEKTMPETKKSQMKGVKS